MTKEEFLALEVGDRVVYATDNMHGTVTEIHAGGTRIGWDDGLVGWTSPRDTVQIERLSHAPTTVERSI